MEPPAGADIRRHLERVLASRTFAGSARLRAFLQYVVDRTRAGETAELKEYAIGVDVFQRGDEYDPRIDSIVRVEAGRLRAKLDEYYATEGADDDVILRIPRGSYVPTFLARAALAPLVGAAPAPPAPIWIPRAQIAAGIVLVLVLVGVVVAATSQYLGRPLASFGRPPTDCSVAVLPFTHYAPGDADAALAARLTDRVTTELARINVVGVVSHTTARHLAGASRPLTELASMANATTAIEGTVVSEGSTVRVRARIVDGRLDRKTAVHDFTGTREDPDALARQIAQALSAQFKARSLR